MNKLKLFSVLALLFVLSGCGLFGGGAVNLTGNWAGNLSGPGGSVPLTMALTQSETAITGTVTLQAGSSAITGNVMGGNVTLTVDGLTFTGTANATTINTTTSAQDQTGNVVTVTLAATKQ